MAYNPSTETRKDKPVTGIVGVGIVGKTEKISIPKNPPSFEQVMRESNIPVEKPKEKESRQQVIRVVLPKGDKETRGRKKLTSFGFLSNVAFGKRKNRYEYSARKSRLADQIKLLRYKNRLEKLRLKNSLDRYKIRTRVESLRRRGLLPVPRIVPRIIQQPFFISPYINADVDSAFNADIGHGDNLFGSEEWFGGENYYEESFWGDEDMFADSGLNFRPGRNPLLF